jgi:hypothetical protein
MSPILLSRAALVPVVLLAACGGDGPSAPAIAVCDAPSSAGGVTQRTATDRWIGVVSVISPRRDFGPTTAMRSYALAGVAAHNAVVAADGASGASRAGAIAGAVGDLLASLYPSDVATVDSARAAESARTTNTGAPCRDAYAAGLAIGRVVAGRVIARAAADGATRPWTGTIPSGPGIWTSAPAPAVPVTPGFGTVRSWWLPTGNAVRPPAPPAFGSAAFLADLEEVRRTSATRTAEQLRIAEAWGNLATPMGRTPAYWTTAALGFSADAGDDEARTALVAATTTMAGMDAIIACWDAKYVYWTARPYQLEPAITTPVGRPNFPAFPSAHSCLSSSMGEVLAVLFPGKASDLRARIAEAGVSRIYAGLHFRVDITAGEAIGRAVAVLAPTRGPRAGQAIPLE